MSTARQGTRRTGWRRIAHLGLRALRLELHGYQSTYRFLFRRPRVPPGASAFSYAQPVLPLMIVFLVLSVLELVVVDVVVRRWPPVRIPLLVLGIWGVTFMVGLLFGLLVRPHAVGPAGLRVRSGTEIDIALTWDDITAVDRRTRRTQEKQPRVTVDEQGAATLHLRILTETNLDVRLERPTVVTLPAGPVTVSAIAFWADDPKGLLEAVRRYR